MDESSISRKERVRRALNHQEVDRLPTQINYTDSAAAALSAALDVAAEDLPDRLGNHLLRLDIDFQPRLSPDGATRYDWWGAGFAVHEEGYFPNDPPLLSSTDLGSCAWPDPTEPALLDGAARKLAAFGADRFVLPNFGFALFERAYTLRGFDTFLMDMILEPLFAEALLEKITEIQLVLIHRYLEMGVDGGYFGDDYGAQKSMLFSPRLWRKFMKPRLARMFAPFREAGLPVILHSDGQIAPILTDLVDIGLTVLNPAQPEVINHAYLRETFGSSLAYYGGISTQTVLPSGTPDEVAAAFDACVRELAPDGTGLLLAPSHRLMSDVPTSSVIKLLELFAAL